MPPPPPPPPPPSLILVALIPLALSLITVTLTIFHSRTRQIAIRIRYGLHFPFLEPLSSTISFWPAIGEEKLERNGEFSEFFHVLAVDDSFVDRIVFERLLKISKYKVIVMDSGSKALQFLGLEGEGPKICFEGLEVNMIITDYSMPRMAGFELLKKIKGVHEKGLVYGAGSGSWEGYEKPRLNHH